LPFTTITGLVDSDLYFDAFINFPARWTNPAFNGVLPKGTPIAQCFPVHREIWAEHFDILSSDQAKRLIQTSKAINAEPGLYRKNFRAAKR
jgi:hypothetical protein